MWRKISESQDVQNAQQEYRKISNQVRRLTRKAQKFMEKQIAKQIKSNPKKFWGYAQSKIKTRSGVPDLEVPGQGLTRNDKEKAEILSEYFNSVFTKESDGELPEISPKHITEELTNFSISQNDIIKKMNKLHISKSPGPDTVHPYVVKEIRHAIAAHIVIIFNNSI